MSALAPRLLAVLVLLAAWAHTAAVVHAWMHTGASPWATSPGATGPIVLVAAGAVWHLAGLATRAGLSAHAGGAVLLALLASASSELAPRATNVDFGDGPLLFPGYLAAAVPFGLFAVAGRRMAPEGVRLLALAAFVATANGKLFAREEWTPYALWTALVCLALGATPLRRCPPSRGALLFGLGVALFVGHVAAAAILGDSLGRGLRMLPRVVFGAVLLFVLARGLDRHGVRTVTRAALFGVASACSLAAVGWMEAAPDEGWGRVLRSRLRLFGMHANGIGPLFAWGAVLALAMALRALAANRARTAALGWTALAAAAAVAVWQTRSSASVGGMLAGVAVLAWLRFGPLPRRAWTVPALVLVPLAAGLALWNTAATDGLRERLDAMTQTQSALGQRYHLWRMALDATAESPWYGRGPGQFYVHAEHARPSFYDGSDQTLHTHNLWLALAEGAGWPALVLFVALLLGTFEVLRRALRDVPRSERAVPVGWFAALCALLAANQLDLGQSQQTFVPWLFWLAAGAVAAWGARPPESSVATISTRQGWTALGLGLVFALPAVLSGSALVEGRIALGTNELRVAQRWLSTAELLQPFDHQVLPTLERLRVRQGRFGEALALAREQAQRTPGRANGWFVLARKAVDLDDRATARAALARARALDPRGRDEPAALALEALLAARDGDREHARDLLLESVRAQGKPWQVWRLARDPETGEPVLDPKTEGGPTFALLELSDEVADAATAIASTEPVRARRELEAAFRAALAVGRPAEAARYLRTFQDAYAGEFPSLQVIEAQALIQAGRAETALERLDAAQNRDHFFVRTTRLVCLARVADEARLAEELEGVGDLHHVLDERDLFLEAGGYAETILGLLELDLVRERYASAARWTRRYLRDLPLRDDRAAAAAELVQRFAETAASTEVLAELVRLWLAEVEPGYRPARDRQALAARTRTLSETLTPDRRAALASELERARIPGRAARDVLARLSGGDSGPPED